MATAEVCEHGYPLDETRRDAASAQGYESNDDEETSAATHWRQLMPGEGANNCQQGPLLPQKHFYPAVCSGCGSRGCKTTNRKHEGDDSNTIDL